MGHSLAPFFTVVHSFMPLLSLSPLFGLFVFLSFLFSIQCTLSIPFLFLFFCCSSFTLFTVSSLLSYFRHSFLPPPPFHIHALITLVSHLHSSSHSHRLETESFSPRQKTTPSRPNRHKSFLLLSFVSLHCLFPSWVTSRWSREPSPKHKRRSDRPFA